MPVVRGGAWVELSQGNLNNGHFYLNRMGDFFPPDAVGGSNALSAGNPVDVVFETGETVSCDIAGDKMILRDRGATARFFDTTGAREGDLVLVEKQDGRRFSVRLLRTS